MMDLLARPLQWEVEIVFRFVNGSYYVAKCFSPFENYLTAKSWRRRFWKELERRGEKIGVRLYFRNEDMPFIEDGVEEKLLGSPEEEARNTLTLALREWMWLTNSSIDEKQEEDYGFKTS